MMASERINMMRIILNGEHSNYTFFGLKEDNIIDILKAKEFILRNWRDGVKYSTYAFYCPNCGAELFGKWHYFDVAIFKKDINEYAKTNYCGVAYEKEYEKMFWQMGKIKRENEEEIKKLFLPNGLMDCPCCHKSLTKDKGFFYSYCEGDSIPDTYYEDFSPLWHELMLESNTESLLDADSIFDFLNKLRKREDESEFEKKKLILIEEYESLPVEKHFSKDAIDAIGTSTAELKRYLKQLINLEMDIYSISKRLHQLYNRQEDLNRENVLFVFVNQRESEADYQNQSERLIQERDRVKGILDNIENVHPRDSLSLQHPTKPRMPVKPIKPYEPSLSKANLFNKKRINEENDRLKKQYSEAMEKYSKELSAYNSECEKIEADYRTECERIDAQYSKKIEEYRQKYLDELDDLEKSLAEAKKVYNNKIQATSLPYYSFISGLLEKEISQAKESLKEFVLARKAYYDNDIVFSKYRNVVALSSFYEYLIAGRCTSLEGTNGAYNLYEAESRADMIITQLSEVVASLDEIKKNQYLIYSQVSETNKNLQKLNKTMDSALNSLMRIEDTSSNIEKTAHSIMESNEAIARNTEVIAYNTEMAAYYAKKNSELTDAVGLMIALK